MASLDSVAFCLDTNTLPSYVRSCRGQQAWGHCVHTYAIVNIFGASSFRDKTDDDCVKEFSDVLVVTCAPEASVTYLYKDGLYK